MRHTSLAFRSDTSACTYAQYHNQINNARKNNRSSSHRVIVDLHYFSDILVDSFSRRRRLYILYPVPRPRESINRCSPSSTPYPTCFWSYCTAYHPLNLRADSSTAGVAAGADVSSHEGYQEKYCPSMTSMFALPGMVHPTERLSPPPPSLWRASM